MFKKKNNGFKTLNDSVPDTLISENVKIYGDLRFSGGIQLNGFVQGDIEAESASPACLWVTETGKVKGQVKVPSVTINGHIEGDVFSTEHLELAANAVVNGNVYYKVIEMAQGAVVNGQLHKEEGPIKASVTSLNIEPEQVSKAKT